MGGLSVLEQMNISQQNFFIKKKKFLLLDFVFVLCIFPPGLKRQPLTRAMDIAEDTVPRMGIPLHQLL